MGDSRHEDLRRILRALPSDFEPWGQRSRDNEWGPDCSCGCRWFVPLETGLGSDWGVCANGRSPRSGLLTFEHQGCREFEGAKDEHDSRREDAGRDQPAAEIVLLENLHRCEPELRAFLESCTDHWGFEDPIYRFYHQSYKVYELQQRTKAIVDLLERLMPDRPLNSWFLEIIAAGTSRTFELQDNARWTTVTRPILEAFFHARFFLEMAVRYVGIERPPERLPSGYAALLYLYGLR